MDTERRKFLKTIFAVGAFLVVRKIVPPLFLKDPAPRPPRRTKAGEAFKVVEGAEIVSVRDESGEEIFQIDNEA